MSDAILALRNLAMSRASQPHPVYIVLDDDLRAEMAKARADLEGLQAARANLERDGDLPPQQPKSLADTTPDPQPAAHIDRMIAKAKEVVAGIEADARESGSVLVVNVRRVTPERYQDELDKAMAAARAAKAKDAHINESAHWMVAIGDRLLELGYVNCTTIDGEDTSIALSELRESVLSHADLENLRTHAISINRTGQAVPFSPANSKPPAEN